MPTYVTSEPKKIVVEDVQFSSSVSEAVANKIAATINYCIDNFDSYDFGVYGNVYSGLSSYPYQFVGCLENIRSNCVIHNIEVYNEVSGISGNTEFKLVLQPAAGGAYVDLFNGCIIQNTAADNLAFDLFTTPPPSGVLLPLSITLPMNKNDKLSLVLTTAADQARNLRVKVTARPA